MLSLRPEHWIISRKSNESLWGYNGVSEVRFQFNKTSLANVPLAGSESDHTWSLTEVSIIGYDLNTSSLGNSNLTFVRA